MDGHTDVDGRQIELKTHIRSRTRTDPIALGVFLCHMGVLNTAQPERKRRTDIREDIDGRPRIERKFRPDIFAVGRLDRKSVV